MKVLVCGGRDYTDKNNVFSTLDEIHKDNKIDVIINGGAKGADAFSYLWAIENNIKVDTFNADWKLYGRAAGIKRNQQMIEANPDLVVAFAGGKGTADMIDRCQRNGIKLIKRD